MAWFGLYTSQAEKDAKNAANAKVASDHSDAVALSNYRQTSRDDYNRLRQSEYSHYSPYNARIAARYGVTIPGMQNGPVSLADSGVGAAQGSNFTGWDDMSNKADAANGSHLGNVVHHTGIGEYLNGTAQAPGSFYARSDSEQGGGGIGNPSAYAGDRHYAGKTVDAIQGGLPQDVQATGATYAPMQTGSAPQAQPMSFFPGRR